MIRRRKWEVVHSSPSSWSVTMDKNLLRGCFKWARSPKSKTKQLNRRKKILFVWHGKPDFCRLNLHHFLRVRYKTKLICKNFPTQLSVEKIVEKAKASSKLKEEHQREACNYNSRNKIWWDRKESKCGKQARFKVVWSPVSCHYCEY